MRRFLSTQPCLFGFLLVVLALPVLTVSGAAVEVCWTSTSSSDDFEFFETRIRPILVEYCYECHNSSDTAEGGLAVDHSDAFLKGGFSGKIIVPGHPEESDLLPILRHEIEGLEMPVGGPKLDERMVKDFEKWIADGAPDPRKQPPTEAEIEQATSWAAMLERRKQWWSFQPIRTVTPPAVDTSSDISLLASHNPIDRFVGQRLWEANLPPANLAEPETLVRRLYFTLIGLPPSPDEALRWGQRLRNAHVDEHQQVVESLVDELLSSPRFGEHWARHWMDWIRYAESHGSEGDPVNANAWLYRDYLIRAWNDDIPYDQLVREHIAGDLLTSPRINFEQGINESIVGTAHWRMVFHGFAPTDALDEKVRFIDDEINAFSKAFLGLTISCARCHDHKFDAISQADYYALFGVLGSCRPGRAAIDLEERQRLHQEELKQLKSAMRSKLADHWLKTAGELSNRLRDDRKIVADAKSPEHWLDVLKSVDRSVDEGLSFAEAWQQQISRYEDIEQQWQRFQDSTEITHWDLAETSDYASWYRTGVGLSDQPAQAGSWSVASQGDNVVVGIYPSGAYSHLISSKHAGRISSPDFNLYGQYEVWLQTIGDPSASVRYVVQDYPRNGTVYPVQKLAGSWQWQRFDVSYWQGDRIHLEVSAAQDAPLLVGGQDRSWLGVRHAVVVEKGTLSPPPLLQHLLPLYALSRDHQPSSRDELIDLMERVLVAAIRAWSVDEATDQQALLLDAVLREKLLANSIRDLPNVAAMVDRYRALEAEVPVAIRVPTLTETEPRDQPLFIRGNHKQAGNPVKRRFLEAIDTTPYPTNQSGRLELANDLLRDDNPLTRRVIVNRVWHHVFGQGIVATPDNFGRLGDRPSHPELLDWLAERFVEEDWSLKSLIREMVTSQAWQLDSQASELSQQVDPENRLLSHAHVRRLEAEAIRDSLLQVAGRLEHEVGGAPVNGNAPRRSVYIRVIRNSLDPFLRAFDFPEPFTTVGRRDVTNVPAQSLTLMNDPQVADAAQDWARHTLSDDSTLSVDDRVSRMFVAAFGRVASSTELLAAKQFLTQTRAALEHQIAEVNQLRNNMATLEKSLESIRLPIRDAILAERQQQIESHEYQAFQPIAAWDFTASLDDLVGEADVVLHGNIRQSPEGLVAKGGYALSPPIPHALSGKTLEAWVQLDNLEQQGGGVVSVQTPDGNEFDAIVFGEQTPGHWLAGSNFFARTQAFQGSAEEEANKEPIHIALSYGQDGSVTAYRNGKPYGKPYTTNGPRAFDSNGYVVGFGIRHLPAGGNKLLAGHILEARLYDRALTAEEIAHSASRSNQFVPEKEITSRMSAEQRDQFETYQRELQTLRSQMQVYELTPKQVDEQLVWTDLARALFTVKEFIYVR